MLVLGVDIGINGGIALLDGDDASVWPMPTVEHEVNGKTKRKVDAVKLARMVHELVNEKPREARAFVEHAHATPQMGVSSAFGFGESFGLVRGVLACLGVPMRLVSPQEWKRALGLLQKGRELGDAMPKRTSIELARELYGKLHRELNFAKDDGKAEALLIAHYGAEELGL